MHDSTQEEDNHVWPTIKGYLQDNLERDDYNSWIAPLDAIKISEEQIKIYVPNVVFQRSIAQFQGQISSAKVKLGFQNWKINIDIQSSRASHSKTDIKPENKTAADKLFANKKIDTKISDSSLTNKSQNKFKIKVKNNNAGLIDSYTFDNFIQGESNQFALSACLTAAENPGEAYNPLFIYGNTGLGKTHLLHAVGARILEINPAAKVVCISSEKFLNNYTSCAKLGKMADFRKRYRTCDVLLIDDIQFLAKKERTQEEFFHTFNALHTIRKQIVVTSDLFPKDLPDIEERIRTRFDWGLIADIKPPSLEHRIAILFAKAEQLNIKLNNEIAEYIAKYIKYNVRALEGALRKLIAYSQLQATPITMDLAVWVFKDVFIETQPKISLEIIQKKVAERFEVKVTDLKSKKRQRTYTYPRQIAMYLTRELLGTSFPEIGERFGGKDHTTVMHNVRKVTKELKVNLDLKADIEALKQKLDRL